MNDDDQRDPFFEVTYLGGCLDGQGGGFDQLPEPIHQARQPRYAQTRYDRQVIGYEVSTYKLDQPRPGVLVYQCTGRHLENLKGELVEQLDYDE